MEHFQSCFEKKRQKIRIVSKYIFFPRFKNAIRVVYCIVYRDLDFF